MLLNQFKRKQFGILNLNYFSIPRRRCLSSAIDSPNCFKLLQDCFKSGRVNDAEHLFDKMSHKNIVTWSIAIHGYAINGFHEKSLNLFSQMRLSGLLPNSFSVVGLLVSLSGIDHLILARSIHALVLKIGLGCNSFVATATLDAYGKCGSAFDSYNVFKELKDPGLVTCNAILAGLMKNGFCQEGIFLFEELRKFGLVPNESTSLTLLNGCVSLRMRRLCESVFSLIIKLGQSSDVSIRNSVLNMYSSLMDLNDAFIAFDEMECKDVISWTTMMGLLVDLEYGSDVFELFFKMKESRVNLDMLVLVNLISACSILGDSSKGRQIHAQALAHGYQLELPLVNSMISMYSKCGNLDSSKTVFNQTPKRSLVSWTAIVSGCVLNGQPMEALDLVIKARVEESYSFDSIMLVSALTASSELVALKFCQQLHCYILASGFSEYRSVQNCLISAYSKCGNVDLSHTVFNEMGLLQDVVSWNAIINGYGINGYGEIALELYNQMINDGQAPDSATYLCILSACSHSGLVTDGLMIFNKIIEDDKIIPSKEHYGCVIDLLTRVGCFTETSEFSSRFLEDMGPNAWKALLNGCALYGNVELAEVAAKHISEMDPGESGHGVLLSKVYSSVGRFGDAQSLRMSMESKGFTKNPGISILNEIRKDWG
ncbi:Pentatricopeptide repeat (PPR) superfamily protein [Euphorbia peplus]|nr:Pentatricopeptide repeat (PPR) superfamily protein [Euphorbia peplus]